MIFIDRIKNKRFFVLEIIVLVLIFFSFAFLIVTIRPPKKDNIKLGVTYSLNYAQELGIDWKKAYLEILDDLKVRYIRLPIYWNIIEPYPGRFDFSKFDFMVEEAEKRGVKIIAVVGRRQPRWPECHVPSWAQNNIESIQQIHILQSIKETVNRYKNSYAIYAWQVDNEPFFSIFGLCPDPDMKFYKEELELVRDLDTRPIVVTDSGELSTWIRTAGLADILGISMYRITWNKYFGYWYYPLSPSFYWKKFLAVSPLVERGIITELQAEPWFAKSIFQTPLSEQYKSMNEDILKDNVDFAVRTGFDEIYLWGVEWWYWLKDKKGEDGMWQTAKEIFDRYNSF